MMAKAYCDGRGNAGTGACGAVVITEYGDYYTDAVKLDPLSNNQAEYQGVLLAIRLAKKHGVTILKIHSDSQLIVNQVNGKWKIKQAHLMPLRDLVWEEAKEFEMIEITWIPREQNEEADVLCREIDPKVRHG